MTCKLSRNLFLAKYGKVCFSKHFQDNFITHIRIIIEIKEWQKRKKEKEVGDGKDKQLRMRTATSYVLYI